MTLKKYVLAALALFAFPVFAADAPDIEKITASAKDGDVRSQYQLGEAYLFGNGIDKDGDQAARWYRKAAAQGYAPAQYRLAALYIKMEGIPDSGVLEDPIQADKWMHRAADQGNLDAMRTLGMMYRRGIAEEKNDTLGFMWLDLAADYGDAQAIKYRDDWLKTIASNKIADARGMAAEWKKTHDNQRRNR